MIKLLQHQYDITRLYRCLIDVEDNKDLMDNFIWLSELIHAFFPKWKEHLHLILQEKEPLFYGNKRDERIHVDKFYKYAIKRKLTILGS